MPADFTTAAVGAVVGVVGGGTFTLAVTMLKSQLDMFSARYEDVCKQIIAAADVGSEYWLLNVSSDIDVERDEKAEETFRKAQLMEARIDGFQQQIFLADEDLRGSMPSAERGLIDIKLRDFIEALMGGQFKSRTGVAETVSASLVQHAAAELVSAIRAGLRQRYTFGFLVKHKFNLH